MTNGGITKTGKGRRILVTVVSKTAWREKEETLVKNEKREKKKRENFTNK